MDSCDYNKKYKYRKKWYVTITLMRGIGEQHAFIRLDIDQAIQLLRYLEEYYYNCVEVPVDDVLLEKILETFEAMMETYEGAYKEEQSGLD